MNLNSIANFTIVPISIKRSEESGAKGKATFLNHKINFRVWGENNIALLEKSLNKEVRIEASLYANFDLDIQQIEVENLVDCDRQEIIKLNRINIKLQEQLDKIKDEVTQIASAKERNTVKAKYVAAIENINKLV